MRTRRGTTQPLSMLHARSPDTSHFGGASLLWTSIFSSDLAQCSTGAIQLMRSLRSHISYKIMLPSPSQSSQIISHACPLNVSPNFHDGPGATPACSALLP